MRYTIFLLLLILWANHSIAQNTKRALFLGNSYTAVNNLPQMVANVALSMNDTLLHDNNTPGGYTFNGHSTNATSLNKIAAGNWDFVVLQEQSQLPSFPDNQVATQVFPYAAILDSLIHLHNPCAETMFYRTWGRKNGDASNCAFFAPLCTYAGMDSMLHLRYMMMADAHDATVSGVGAVWKYIRTNFPTIELYQADESHPSVAGTYAAAVCFYVSMFQKDPMLVSYNGGLSSAEADSIKSAVKMVVYNDLSAWFIGTYAPNADFTFSVLTDTVAFSNSSRYSTDFHWDFGDGNTSTLENPTHQYAASGNYTVTLIVSNCDQADTIVMPVNITLLGIEKQKELADYQVYPNPVSNQLFVKLDDFNLENLFITDLQGKIYYPKYNVNNQVIIIDFLNYAAGVYFLNLRDGEKVLVKKVVKN